MDFGQSRYLVTVDYSHSSEFEDLTLKRQFRFVQ